MRSLAPHLRALFKQPNRPQSIKRYHWVDLLRGLDALTVLIWHYQLFLYSDAGVNPFLSGAYRYEDQPFYNVLWLVYGYGPFAVPLFWAISGFVFAATYCQTTGSSREFFVARFARLYPLHFATLLAVALLQTISFLKFNEFQVFPNNDLYHFGLNLLFISYWGFEKGSSFNDPIWSVSVEVLIYILFWVVVRRIFKRGLLGVLLLGGFFLVAAVRHIPGQFWGCGLYFFMGCAAWVWFTSFQQRPLVNLGAAIAACIAGVQLLSNDLPFPGYSYEIGRIFLSCGMVLFAASIDSLDTIGYGKKTAWLGDISYSIYLLHVPIIIAAILVMDALLLDRVQIVLSGWFFLAFIAVVISMALPCYRYFELPSRLWIRRRFGSSNESARNAEKSHQRYEHETPYREKVS